MIKKLNWPEMSDRQNGNTTEAAVAALLAEICTKINEIVDKINASKGEK
jgi:hypothetical protein